MRVDEAYPGKYLKAADLKGRAAQVTIVGVEFETLDGTRKVVLRFRGKDRGMVLNKTNARNIAKFYGDEMDGWIGKDIVLFEAMVDFQGETVPALRVRAPKAEIPLAKKTSADDMVEGPTKQPRRSSAEMDDEIPFSPEFR